MYSQSQQLHICDPMEKIDLELWAFLLIHLHLKYNTWEAKRQIQPCTTGQPKRTYRKTLCMCVCVWAHVHVEQKDSHCNIWFLLELIYSQIQCTSAMKERCIHKMHAWIILLWVSAPVHVKLRVTNSKATLDINMFFFIYLFVSNILPCHLLNLFPKRLWKILTTHTDSHVISNTTVSICKVIKDI